MTFFAISSKYRKAAGWALALQLPVELLCSIILDGEVLFKISVCAFAGFWAGVALIVYRRPRDPQPQDLSFIRIGFFPLLAIAFALAMAESIIFQKVRGY